MPTDKALLEQLRKAARTTSSLLALAAEPDLIRSKNQLKFSFALPTGKAAAYLRVDSGQVQLTMRAQDKRNRQALRRILLGAARLVALPHEHHILDTFEPGTPPRRILKSLASWLQAVPEEAALRHKLYLSEQEPGKNDIFGFWADVRANFGDQIGPWLVQELAGKRIVNSRYSTHDHGRMLVTIGSIIQMLPTSATREADIWGAGLMRRLKPEDIDGLTRLKDVKVHAVRGKLTRQSLQDQLGWDVPEVYGDPALLCPRYYTPESAEEAAGKVAFVPHFKHVEHHFANAGEFQAALGQGVHLVDVHTDLRDVISQIASARVCVSSSLHGIIIAQAYGIPWVWLYAPDKNIGGDRFKFDDFFSTLADPEAVASHAASVGDFVRLPFDELAVKATLPKLGVDLDALQNAFPLERGGFSPAPIQPRFKWNRFSAENRFMADVRAAYRLTH